MPQSQNQFLGNLSGNIPPDLAGHATIDPSGEIEAGSYATFTLVYTAGFYGIDDSGSIKIVSRFASDQTKPQFDDPKGPGYTTVTASKMNEISQSVSPSNSLLVESERAL